MTAWFEDVLEFGNAIRNNGGMVGGASPNYPVNTALEIYRNNYRGNLQGALKLAYPVTSQLVGDDFFRMMAIRYIESHPSRSGNLHDYGAELSAFLESFPNAPSYLPDIAKLEWACHLAYFASDVDALNITALAGIAQENQGCLHFLLNPACRIVRSFFPIVDIWLAHQPGMPEDFRIDLDIGPQVALVNRRNGVVLVEALSVPESEWLTGIQSGSTLWDVAATVLENHPEFDLEAHLVNWIEQEILVDFDLEAKEY